MLNIYCLFNLQDQKHRNLTRAGHWRAVTGIETFHSAAANR
jgi:hypothetical protein